MPAAQKIARAGGGAGPDLRARAARTDRPPRSRRLRRDGVTCTVCHQIAPDRLGTRESFNGNFVVAPPLANGRRRAFGPFAPDAGRRRHHALGHRVRAGAGAAHPAVGAVRDLPHAHHRSLRSGRRGHRVVARADELPGVAAQRVLRRAAQLPVVPHAAGAGTGARRVGAGRRPAEPCRGTRSSAATPSCSV